jgi:uncharacterized protein with von Willebrand factor type A (vWA) domain
MANAMESAPIGFVNEERRREMEQHRAAKERQKQTLNLQRENILSQVTSNPVRRQALEAALSQVEAQIAAIG